MFSIRGGEVLGLWALLASAPAFAAAPEVALVWKGGAARVEVVAPAGLHVAPEAPARVAVGEVRIELRGDPSVVSFPVPAGEVQAEASFSLCEDAGSACHVVTVAGTGAIAGRKGRFALTPPVAAPVVAAKPGAPVRLLDFGAVWCPPCNLLNAEVLDDPSDAPALASYVVETIDVDRPESWSRKARYGVGGYPTLIAVDAAGLEVDRLVGYPGEAPTLAWLAALSGVTPLHALDGEPALTGLEASAVARRFAEAQNPERARAYLARGADGVDLRVARLGVDPTPDDARWLFDHDAAPGPWIFDALSAAPDLWPRVATILPALAPADAADCLALAADGMEKTDPDGARIARGAAIALLRGTFTGDPAHDRGHAVFIADLQAGIGELDAGLAGLDGWSATYPAEFTFDFAAARHLVDAGRFAEAEPRARRALEKAWGDQRLRAVQTLAAALGGLDRRAEALAALDAELARAEKPAADVAVRTHRYLAQVTALREELAK